MARTFFTKVRDCFQAHDRCDLNPTVAEVERRFKDELGHHRELARTRGPVCSFTTDDAYLKCDCGVSDFRVLPLDFAAIRRRFNQRFIRESFDHAIAS